MDTFSGLAVVLGLAAVGGIAAKALKQPVILGYLVAGVVVSGWQSKQMIDFMGQVGITLLLFLVGLELPINELKKIGKLALVSGIGQIILTAGVGIAIAIVLGLGLTTAVYIGMALTFSSTIIIVKLLSEKGDIQSLPGRIALGCLLVQDFVAIGMLVMLTATGNQNLSSILGVLVKGVGLVGGTLWLADKVLPQIAKWIAGSTEILFISSIGWCLVIAAVVASPVIGFGVEMGGLLAGLALASAMETVQITARVRPLRDFFMTMFFVSLGASVQFGLISTWWWATLVFIGFVLVGKPLLMMTILGWVGYKKRVAFLAGITMAQISEFSLIVMATAVRLGQVDKQVLGIVTMIGIVSMTGGTYLMVNGQKLYKLIGKYIPFKERGLQKTESVSEQLKDHIILFGHNRVGSTLRPTLEKLGKPLIVVDFNPEVVEKLLHDGVRAIYGDASDSEIYAQINLKEAALIVCTVSDVADTKLILAEIGKSKDKPLVVTISSNKEAAGELYTAGADLVVVPHTVGGEYLAGIFEQFGLERKMIVDKGKQHQKELDKI